MENPLFIKRTAAIETDRDDKDPSKTLMAQGLPIEQTIVPDKSVTADVAASDTKGFQCLKTVRGAAIAAPKILAVIAPIPVSS